MAVILEVKMGPLAGKRIAVPGGQTVLVGRTPQANFALPHDTFMSGVHFAVECGPQGCRVIDRKSRNGTFLNGAKITEALLSNGDEIRSGQACSSYTWLPRSNCQVQPQPRRHRLRPLQS